MESNVDLEDGPYRDTDAHSNDTGTIDGRIATLFDNHRTRVHPHRSPTHQNTLVNNLAQHLDSGQFSDIDVSVQGIVFHCHRIILASSCPYFRALFLHQSDHSVLNLDEITPTGFSDLLHYMYTGKITLSEQTLEEVLAAADFLQFRDLVELCAPMLMQQLRVNNCLRIMHLADGHSLEDLKLEAHKFVLAHFQSVIWSEDFTSIPYNSLTELVKHPHLYVNGECDVLVAVSRWLQERYGGEVEVESTYEPARLLMLDENIENLLRYCDLSRCSDADIQMCVDNYPIIAQSGMIQDRLQKEGQNKNPHDSGDSCLRRKEMVAVVIRKPATPHNKMMYYSPSQSQWIELTQLPYSGLSLFSTAVLDNDVYITGGMINERTIDKPITVNWVYRYQTQDDKWSEVMHMLRKRRIHGSAALHGRIYVIGGAGDESSRYRDDGEVYDPATDQWTMLPSVPYPGGVIHPSVVPLNGLLYVIGGTHDRPEPRNSTLIPKSALLYNPKSNEWSDSDPLNQVIKYLKLKPGSQNCLSYLGFLMFSQLRGEESSWTLYNPVAHTAEELTSCSSVLFGGYTMYRDELVMTGGVKMTTGRMNTDDAVHSCDLSEKKPEWVRWTPLPNVSSHHPCFTLFLNEEDTEYSDNKLTEDNASSMND